MKKFRLSKIRLDEISAVDRPAQAPARAVLIKRDFTAEQRQSAAESGAALPDGSYPIHNSGDLHNAMQALGRAKDREAVVAHIKSRAKSLGLTSELTDTYKALDGRDNSMTPEQLAALQKQAEDVKAENEKLLKRAERAERLASLSDAQKQHLNSLSQPQQDTFLALEPKAREGEVAKAATRAADSNPVVETIDGQEFRKNDDPRALHFARLAAESRQRMEKAEGEAAQTRLQKRAESELNRLPGKEPAKIALLGVLEKHLPKEHQEEVLNLLKAANSGLAAAMQKQGSRGEPDPVDTGDRNAVTSRVVKRLMEADPKLSTVKAYEKAMADPEVVASYNQTRR